MSGGEYIAIDWGTTNRRIYAMRGDGSYSDYFRDNRGVLALSATNYPAEFAAIRARFGQLPIVAAGMVGSNRGYREIAYCQAPTDIEALASGVVACDDDVHIVPGLCLVQGERSDVMRGEEVQVLGALASGSVFGPAVFCQPGTHNKWIETDGTQITGFATAMTGELFALLREHSVLSDMLRGAVANGLAFREGLTRGSGAANLLTLIFEARAAALLGSRSLDDTASYVSGLLVGSDVGSRGDLGGRTVVLLADGELAGLYTAAINAAGGLVKRIDSGETFRAGIDAIWKACK